jgi:hypothetical protein
MAMVDVPMIASIQPIAEPPVQHVVVPVIAVPAWAPNGFSNGFYQAPAASGMWISPMGGCEAPWQQRSGKQSGQSGYAPCFFPCHPTDGASTTASSRQSKSPESHSESSTSDSGGRDSNLAKGHASADGCVATKANADKNVTVVLGNLPKLLCNQQCVAAAMEQARLKGVVAFEVIEKNGSEGAEAVVILESEIAAQRFMKHFQGLKWGKSKPIAARYCAAAGRRLLERRDGGNNSDPEEQPRVDCAREDCPPSPLREDSPSQVRKNIIKLRRKLREIQMLKKFPAEQLDKMQRRKVEGKTAIITQLADLGEYVAEDEGVAALMLTDIPQNSSRVGGTPDSKTKKLWADLDSDDELGDDYQSTFAESNAWEAPEASDREDF